MNHLGIALETPDGTVWDLINGPVRLKRTGVKGLGMPTVASQVQELANVDGQRLAGWTLKPREVILPLRFEDASNTDLEGLQRTFWNALGIGVYSDLRVTTADGRVRHLRVRFESDNTVAYEIQPYIYTAPFDLYLIADDPWWFGDPMVYAYSLAGSDVRNFFGGLDPAMAGVAPPFYISRSSGQTAFNLTNPGDIDAWPVWEIDGPVSIFSVGVSGKLVSGMIPILEGSSLIISTDPANQSAKLDGVRVTRQLTALNFAPLPAGVQQALTIAVTGTGLVKVTFNPRYKRGF